MHTNTCKHVYSIHAYFSGFATTTVAVKLFTVIVQCCNIIIVYSNIIIIITFYACKTIRRKKHYDVLCVPKGNAKKPKYLLLKGAKRNS